MAWQGRNNWMKHKINLGSVPQWSSLDLASRVLAVVLHALVHQWLAKLGVQEKGCQLVGMWNWENPHSKVTRVFQLNWGNQEVDLRLHPAWRKFKRKQKQFTFSSDGNNMGATPIIISSGNYSSHTFLFWAQIKTFVYFKFSWKCGKLCVIKQILSATCSAIWLCFCIRSFNVLAFAPLLTTVHT